MTDCIRKHNFRKSERHICFFCLCSFSPGIAETCPVCNWKKCINGHCGCSVSVETKKALDTFASLFCNTNEQSTETKTALYYVLETYYQNCLKVRVIPGKEKN